jgi:hypothetical protein
MKNLKKILDQWGIDQGKINYEFFDPSGNLDEN